MKKRRKEGTEEGRKDKAQVNILYKCFPDQDTEHY